MNLRRLMIYPSHGLSIAIAPFGIFLAVLMCIHSGTAYSFLKSPVFPTSASQVFVFGCGFLVIVLLIVTYHVICILRAERRREQVLQDGKRVPPAKVAFRKTTAWYAWNTLYSLVTDYQVLRASYTFETETGDQVEGSGHIVTTVDPQKLPNVVRICYIPENPEQNVVMCQKGEM